MLRLTPLDALWQFAAAARLQLFHHVRAELRNQAENVFGGEGVVAGPIYRITDRHIAGKAQQAVIYILRPQLGHTVQGG